MTPEHVVFGAALAAEQEQRRSSIVFRIRRCLHEPLLHFVLIGWALFAGGQWYHQHIDSHRIDMTSQRQALLAKRYALQFGATPSAATLRLLVDEDIRDEILFRESMSLQLDVDDEIVRRRMVQKMQFLLEDTHAPAEPTDAQLEDFYSTQRMQYAAPERISFTHIYFTAEQGDARAQARVQSALNILNKDQHRAPELGDAFPDAYDFSAYEPAQIAHLFGQTEFASAVSRAPIAQWSGPFRSAYGWHLLYIHTREPARDLPLAEVKDRVRADYLAEAQRRTNIAAFNAVAQKYTVTRQP